MKHCPLCHSERIHQSRRRGIVEEMLAIIFVRPLRCERCDFRFFRISLTANVNASRDATTY
jgi:predicted Zn-ribbon and HTH transcriptional regulator